MKLAQATDLNLEPCGLTPRKRPTPISDQLGLTLWLAVTKGLTVHGAP